MCGNPATYDELLASALCWAEPYMPYVRAAGIAFVAIVIITALWALWIRRHDLD